MPPTTPPFDFDDAAAEDLTPVPQTTLRTAEGLPLPLPGSSMAAKQDAHDRQFAGEMIPGMELETVMVEGFPLETMTMATYSFLLQMDSKLMKGEKLQGTALYRECAAFILAHDKRRSLAQRGAIFRAGGDALENALLTIMHGLRPSQVNIIFRQIIAMITAEMTTVTEPVKKKGAKGKAAAAVGN